MAAYNNKILLLAHVVTLILISFSSLPSVVDAKRYNVVSFGARADGVTDSTKAFLSAWSRACASTTPATIVVPRGRFAVVNMVTFQGPCNNRAILVHIRGTLVAPWDYTKLASIGNWILFDNVAGVTVAGGTLDAQGSSLWSCKSSGNNCPSGATSLEFTNSKDIVISGLTSLNSQMFHIVINACENVKVQGVRVFASGNSPNTDGIHVEASIGVTIMNSRIGTGDDCVSIGPGSQNMWVENVQCGPGHGISIGSLGEDLEEAGVQNITVRSTTFTGTQNGVRIKSWARVSSGFARNILFQHAVMNNVQNPIVIDQHYCPDTYNCPEQVAGVRISDVTYQDIHGTSATQVAVNFNCNKEYPCSRITLQDVKLTYNDNQAALASCSNADGTASGYVQPSSCL